MGVSEEQSSKRLPFCTIDCMEGKEMGTIFGWHIRKFMSGVLNSQYKVLMPLIAVLAYCWLGKLPVYASTVPGCFPQLCCLMLVCFFSFTFTFTSLPFPSSTNSCMFLVYMKFPIRGSPYITTHSLPYRYCSLWVQ